MTEVNKTEGKREGTNGRIPFKTFEKGFYANIPSPAEILKSGFMALISLGTRYAPYDGLKRRTDIIFHFYHIIMKIIGLRGVYG